MEKKIFVCRTQRNPKMIETRSEKRRAAGINISIPEKQRMGIIPVVESLDTGLGLCYVNR